MSKKSIPGPIGILCIMLAASLVAHDGRAATQDASAAIDAAIAGKHRSEENRARDRYRHPKETLAFFGFRPDMTVVEIWPGTGWYTEILAPALREKGKFYAAQYSDNPPFAYQRQYFGTFLGMLGKTPEVFDKVVVTHLGFPGELEVAPPGSADLVVTFRNLHNWFEEGYGADAARLAFKAMFDALKPGGTLGIVDHRWPDPATEDPAAANGYVSEERARQYAEAAGFEFVARSDINRNPKDTHDYPEGVWTLPPTLALGEEDRDRYLAIGESDRFTLKFRKPAGTAEANTGSH